MENKENYRAVDRLYVPDWLTEQIQVANFNMVDHMKWLLQQDSRFNDVFNVELKDLDRLQLNQSSLRNLLRAPFLMVEPTLQTIEDWRCFVDDTATTVAVDILRRAAHFGFPTANAIGGGVSAAHWTAAALTETQYGQLLVNQWFTGVYHAPVVLTPVTKIGIGEYETSLSGFPAAWGSATLEDTSIQQITTGAPLTFPCQGVTGLPPKAHTETPTPPNTSGPWGTPVIVMGNATDTIVLTSGTMTDPSGNVTNLQLLYSANDPNKKLQPYEAVAYPTTPLAENTTYTVNVSGTQNGKPFTKPPFPFTTGTINW
ncbi:hypothetical protein OH764_35190 (plasmid) [Burkholderia sp. M6-3]